MVGSLMSKEIKLYLIKFWVYLRLPNLDGEFIVIKFMFYREKILKKFYENAAKKFKSHELFTNSINFYSLW